MLSLPFSSKLSLDSSQNIDFRSAKAKFGDSYEQIVPRGLNNVFRTFNFTWKDLTKSEKIVLWEALSLNGSWEIYHYLPCDEETTYHLRCETSTIALKIIGNNLFEVSATFRQVFDQE